MNKKILIATQSLGIGGCETYILTQCKELVSLGYEICIAAKSGILDKEFEKLGIKIFDINYIENNYIENINKINEIIKEEKIEEIHIHPFRPFLEPAICAILNNKPYYLYFHGVSFGKYANVEDTFASMGVWYYQYLTNIAFKYATNYIYVSEETKEFYEENYNFEKSKGIILENSIECNIETNPTEKLNQFLIVSRIDSLKINSIKKGIDFYINFCNYYLENKLVEKIEFNLNILGDGDAVEELNKYIENNKEKYNIKLIGPSSNVIETIKEYDVILGMGRCALEAMSIKKLPILISYENYCGIINASSDNIKEINYANFSGRNITKNNIEKDIEFLANLNSEKLNNILNENYNYLLNNKNIKINLNRFLNEINNKPDYKYAKKDLKKFLKLIEYVDYLKYAIFKNEEKSNQKIDELNKINEEKNNEIENLKNINKEKEEKINDLQNQLNNIRNKKAYKIYKKFFK